MADQDAPKPPRFKQHSFFHGLTLEQTLHQYHDVVRSSSSDAEKKRGVIRDLCRQDLFYLLTHMLGRFDMCHPWLFERCREVQLAPDGYLDLWAREHYKSTIITYGLVILDILNNPEITIGLFSHTRDIAQDFLKAIKTTLESNIDLKYTFSDILFARPRVQSSLWSDTDGIIVNRKNVRKEATVEAWGIVDGMPTGRHFDIRVYDDLVTEKSVTNPNMIKKVTDQWALSTNLGTEGGVERYAGTYYHLHDSYHAMEERGIRTRVYPCTSDGSDDFRKTVFRSPVYLAEKKKKQGTYIFSCQMLLNPLADSVQGFHNEWWRTWPATNQVNLNKIILVDPSSGRRREQGNADNDYTSMWVLGLGGDDNWYVCDMVRDRLSLTERARALMQLHRDHRPRRVGYEEYGMQADIEHIEDLQVRENYRFKITPLGGQLKKIDRIKRLIPLFESGQIFMPDSLIKRDWEGKAVDLVRTFKEEEYSKFPVLIHDDMLDALSRVCDEEMASLPAPAPQEAGYKAIEEYKRQKRRNRAVV